MKKNKLLQWSIITLLILQCSSFSYALSVETHEDINEYIARTPLNGFSFELYLKNNLGIEKGTAAGHPIRTEIRSPMPGIWTTTGCITIRRR